MEKDIQKSIIEQRIADYYEKYTLLVAQISLGRAMTLNGADNLMAVESAGLHLVHMSGQRWNLSCTYYRQSTSPSKGYRRLLPWSDV